MLPTKLMTARSLIAVPMRSPTKTPDAASTVILPLVSRIENTRPCCHGRAHALQSLSREERALVRQIIATRTWPSRRTIEARENEGSING